MEICSYERCDEPAEEWSLYCYRHEAARMAGPQVGVGLPGDQVGDLLPDIRSVTLEEYAQMWQGVSVSQRELAEQVARLLDRWDPDNVVSRTDRISLLQLLIGWLPRAELTQPFDVAEPPEVEALLLQTAAVWVSEGMHFAAADAARSLVEIAVVPALALLAGDSSGRGAVLATGAMLIAKFNTLKAHLTVLDDPDERSVYEAVHAASWDIASDTRGIRHPVERGADPADVQATTRLTQTNVDRILRHLRERGILSTANGRWHVAF